MTGHPAATRTRHQRSYTPSERADGLAAVAAAGGCVRRASRQIGVPARTLAGWRAAGPDLVGPDRVLPLADELDRLARRVAGAMLATGDAEIRRLTFLQKLKALFKLIDIVQKLRTHADHFPAWFPPDPAAAPAADGYDYDRLSNEQLDQLEMLMELARVPGHTQGEGG